MAENPITVAVRVCLPDLRPVMWNITPTSIEQNQNYMDQSLSKSKKITKESFGFQHVFSSDTTSRQIYHATVKETVSGVLNGYTGCAFAFGQTNSGKTYTMHGTKSMPGLIPLAMSDIFEALDKDEANRSFVKVSFMEVYNETVKDLLSKEQTVVDVLSDPTKGVVLKNLSEHYVSQLSEVTQLIDIGETRRAVDSNMAHDHASRSHTIFQVTLEIQNGEDGEFTRSVLQLVDLAGSEITNSRNLTTEEDRIERDALSTIAGSRINESQKRSEMKKNLEGSNIRTSLSTLITCVTRIREGAAHIPFRASVLTRILSPALIGNTRTVIIATVSPCETKETSSTLRFASNAQMIKKGAPTRTVVDAQTAILALQQNQMEQLKSESKKKEALADTKITTLSLDKTALERRVVQVQSELAQMEQKFNDLLVSNRSIRSAGNDSSFYVEKRQAEFQFVTEKLLKAFSKREVTPKRSQSVPQECVSNAFDDWETTKEVKCGKGFAMILDETVREKAGLVAQLASKSKEIIDLREMMVLEQGMLNMQLAVAAKEARAERDALEAQVKSLKGSLEAMTTKQKTTEAKAISLGQRFLQLQNYVSTVKSGCGSNKVRLPNLPSEKEFIDSIYAEDLGR